MMKVSLVPMMVLMTSIIILLSSGSARAAKQVDFGKWAIPSNNMPYLPLNAVVGDFVTFEWQGGPFHNVYYHPNGKCDIDDTRVEIGLTSPSMYTFKEEDGSPTGNTMLFTCDVTGHCDAGMQIAITVFSSQEDLDVVSGGGGGSGLGPTPTMDPAGAPTPTMDPAGAPTDAPTSAGPSPSLVVGLVTMMMVVVVAASFVSVA